MRNFFIDSIDAAPLQDDNFSNQFQSWISVLISVLNEDFDAIENNFNVLPASAYTSTEINDLFMAGSLPDGVLLYDTDLDVYVGKEAGTLVKFTTTSYP